MRINEYKNVGETIYEEVLDNGLKIYIVPKPGFSSKYAVFGTNYGGAMRKFEIDGQVIDTPAGVAHFLEHKMFDLPNGDNALSILSANGADSNAFTASNVTCYYFKCAEEFEANLKMLLHFVSTPYFTQETVSKEQGIIGQEIQMNEDSPMSCLYYNFLGLLFDHHPIREKVVGSIDSIAEITDKTLYDCHKVFYAPSNMVLCVEGDVNPEEIIKIAVASLPAEKSSIPQVDYGSPEELAPVAYECEKSMEVAFPTFIIGGKLPFSKSPRERIIASLALRLMLGQSSSFYSRLYQEGKINHNLDFEVEYSSGVAFYAIDGEGPDPKVIFNEILKEAERIKSVGFDEDYYSRCYKSIIGGRLRGLEDFEDVCLSLVFAAFDGYNFFDSFSELNNIKKEDCEKWISENILKDRMVISIISPNR